MLTTNIYLKRVLPKFRLLSNCPTYLICKMFWVNHHSWFSWLNVFLGSFPFLDHINFLPNCDYEKECRNACMINLNTYIIWCQIYQGKSTAQQKDTVNARLYIWLGKEKLCKFQSNCLFLLYLFRWMTPSHSAPAILYTISIMLIPWLFI